MGYRGVVGGKSTAHAHYIRGVTLMVIYYKKEGTYQPLKAYSRNMKLKPTPSEARLWEILKDKYGIQRIHRQVIFGWYIVDFVAIEKHLAIELDGAVHIGREGYDRSRDKWIESCGLSVIRFPNSVAWENPNRIITEINSHQNYPIRSYKDVFRVANSKRRASQLPDFESLGLCFDPNGKVVQKSDANDKYWIEWERSRQDLLNRQKKNRRNRTKQLKRERESLGKPGKRVTETSDIPKTPYLVVKLPVGRIVFPDGSTARQRCTNCDTAVSSRWAVCRGCGSALEFY